MPSPGVTQSMIDRSIRDTLTPTDHVPSSLDAGLDMEIVSADGVLGGAALVHVRLSVTEQFELFAGADNANKAGGIKLFDFPKGIIVPVATRFALVLSDDLPLGETTAGEIGLGTTVASGAVAVLGGTAAFENFCTGLTLGDITAGNTLAVNLSAAGQAPIGTPASELDLFLNLATAFSDEASAHSVLVDSGTIDIWYIHTP